MPALANSPLGGIRQSMGMYPDFLRILSNYWISHCHPLYAEVQNHVPILHTKWLCHRQISLNSEVSKHAINEVKIR